MSYIIQLCNKQKQVIFKQMSYQISLIFIPDYEDTSTLHIGNFFPCEMNCITGKIPFPLLPLFEFLAVGRQGREKKDHWTEDQETLVPITISGFFFFFFWW
jgi:hypothetical protein